MTQEVPGFAAEPLARRLHAAWRDRVPIAPFGERGAITTVEQAYAVQQAWARLRVAEGETVVGRKIGLTSPGMQRQMGVSEPDFGQLWGSRWFAVDDDGVATVPVAPFLQPRAEGEVAFRMRRALRGPGATADDVLDAADAAALAVEIVDSRIEAWRIQLVDTVADNASYGGFACGPWSAELLAALTPETRFRLARNGVTEVDEPASAVLGSPLLAVAWLANTLGRLGGELRAGDVVLSGSFGPALPISAGDELTVAGAGAAPLTVRIA